MKIKLQNEPTYDLDKLLDVSATNPSLVSDTKTENAVRTDAVPTGAVPTGTVPTAADRTGADRTGADRTGADRTGADRTVAPSAVRTGRYDKLHDEFPERTEIRLRAGTTALLKAKAKELGFGSMSKLIRAALKFALEHEDFRG